VPDVLVLCYHAISERWKADIAVTPKKLREQLEVLVRRGYRGATFRDAVTSRRDAPTVAVTFDDAFMSVYETARPILAALELPGTVFAVADFVGTRLSWSGIDQWRDGDHDDELRGMSWAQLESLAREGWEVGSHTCTHPRLTKLDDDALRHELRRSKVACERALGVTCHSIAYPYGDVDDRVAAAAADAGYAAGAALPARLHSGDRLRWPRIGVYCDDSPRRFRMKVSPVVRRLRVAAAPVEESIRAGSG
jgi:peptidoglycan/xylan/chitin deacetylase (PgdA/CDA1 family)